VAVIGFSFAACGDDDPADNEKKPGPDNTPGNQLPGGTLYTTLGGGNKNIYTDGYGYQIGYETWATGSGANIRIYGQNQGGGAAFRAEWSNSGNYLARVGWFWNGGQPYTYYGDLFCDFNFVRSDNGTAGGYSYIGLYGWSRNPSASNSNEKLIEYYIVEDWFGEGIIGPNTMGGGATKQDEYTLDNATYFIYKATRINQPSIDPENRNFTQYFSIRQTRRKSGTISITEHFNAWKDAGLDLGNNLYECKFLVESAGGTGYFDSKLIKFYKNVPPPVYGAQNDGSYTLNPAGFAQWYGATKAGNKISFTDGGMTYDYPNGFNINNYGSLEIVYTVSNCTNKTPPEGKDGGAAIVVKIIDKDKTLGSNSYYGTNAKFITLDSAANSILLINEDENYQDKSFGDYWHSGDGDKGFAIAVNTYDTNDTFDITFHSITFKPPTP